MSNVAGKAYGMNVITPIPPSTTWIQRFIFMTARAFPSTLSGLLNLSLIHFARWVLIERDQWPEGDRGKPTLNYDYMLFCSNFNGTWDQYIDAFSDGIPQGLNLFWYASLKYPLSIPITAFKSYITRNQFHNGYYYNATPGSAQRDIKAALKVFAALKSLESLHRESTAEAFAMAYNKTFAKVQNCLGSPGYAPIASLDTQNADIHRAEFLAEPANKVPPAAASGAGKSGRPPRKYKSGNTFDGGHCFLTAVMPIKTDEVVNSSGMRSSPVHMVRDALATLPTAHQSPATRSVAKDSPFARSVKTHFARMAVIDDVIFNGRVATNTITDAIVNLISGKTSWTTPERVDQLPCPYLMLAIDCDARKEAELRDYLCETWRTMAEDLEPIFSHCFRYSEEATSPDGFADYVLRCRVETTMPFNDYWTTPPPLPSLSLATVAIVALVAGGLVAAALYVLFVRMLDPDHSTLARTAMIIALTLSFVAAGLYAAYRLVMVRGSRPFPAAPDSDLPSVLKALYLQRALIWFATVLQGAPPDRLYQAFGAFLDTVRPSDPASPTQAPGNIPI
jgi:hypothetical protein